MSDLCPGADDIRDENVYMTSTLEDFLAQIEFIAIYGYLDRQGKSGNDLVDAVLHSPRMHSHVRYPEVCRRVTSCAVPCGAVPFISGIVSGYISLAATSDR